MSAIASSMTLMSKPCTNLLYTPPLNQLGKYQASSVHYMMCPMVVRGQYKGVVSCDIIILRSSSAFNLELDFMLDKFDSDGEEPNPALNDVDHIAHKYYTKSKILHQK